jgi:transcriptional regulator with XRE-family HTH domain
MAKVVKKLNIKSSREKLGLTQKQVAELAQISKSYYNEIEKGKKRPTIPVAGRVAQVLMISPLIFFEARFADGDKKVV